VKKVFLCVLVVTLMFGLAACAQPVAGEVIQSEKQRVTSPDVNEADMATLVDGNSAFAFDLYPGTQGGRWQPLLLTSQHLAGSCDDIRRCPR